MKLWHKIGAGLATLTLSVFGFAAPAMATVWHNCPEDYACFYQWLNYGAPAGDANPGWKSSFYNLNIHIDGCINLLNPAAYWPNGTPVWDNEASMVINGSGTYGTGWYVSIYAWSNCNSQGGVASFPADRATNYNDMGLIQIGSNPARYAYHNIESISLKHA